MRAAIIRIGNSHAVPIPEALLEQCRLRDIVELEIEDGRLVIRPAEQVRSGWDEAFRSMADQGDDALFDRGTLVPTGWDESEWEW